jgi:xylulokinase
MTYLLGIDIGTSSAKTIVLDAESGQALGQADKEYPINQPQPGYAEQDPEDWWQAAIYTVRSAIAEAGIDASAIRAIGLSGQMHGTVCLDKTATPLRPAIIWADTRSSSQVNRVNENNSVDEMGQYAPGPPAAGFMASTLMWLTEHESKTMAATEVVILPKDYVRLRLTGMVGTEVSDAASTWLLDVASGQWSDKLVATCGLEHRYLPTVSNSLDVVGTLTTEAAEALGLPTNVEVIAGCADQPAQSMGYGLYNPGTALATIATGGQVVHPLPRAQTDPQMRMYVFNHAVPDRWYGLAAMLSAGLSLRWLRDVLGLSDHPDPYGRLSELAAQSPLGAEGLVFLPYLTGERTPLMDPEASGAFVGLRLHHTAGHLARAVMEGVTFAMSECLGLIADLGDQAPTQVIASGGAAKSAVWRQIQADFYNVPLLLSPDAAYACVGAAILAGFGCGIYPSLDEACSRLPKPEIAVTPDATTAAFYQERRGIYRNLYQQLKDDMHQLGRDVMI